MNIQDIDQHHLCIGCGLCASVAGQDGVKWILGEDGFNHPVGRINDESSMRLIEACCPGLNVQNEMPLHKPEEKIWGAAEKICRAYAKDSEMRWKASAGGALSGLLVYLLEKKVVSGVVHIGASSTNPILNEVTLSRSRGDVLKKVGSRYQPAAPLKSILQILESDPGPLAFVGKPCDVAALRAFLKRSPKWANKVSLFLSFFCGGTPSLNGTFKLLQAMGVSREAVSAFRYRGHGWPGKTTATDTQGRVYEMNYETAWGDTLSRHVHWRCKMCADSVGFAGDLVFGDAWEEKNGQPDFSEKPGKSLVIMRNHFAGRIFEEAVRCGYLEEENYDFERLRKVQPYQYSRRQKAGVRLFAAKLLGFWIPRYQGFDFLYHFRNTPKKELLAEFLNTLRHLLEQNAMGRFVCAIALYAKKTVRIVRRTP